MNRQNPQREKRGVRLFLASDDASFVTGAVIMVDGGSAMVDVGTLAYKTAL